MLPVWITRENIFSLFCSIEAERKWCQSVEINSFGSCTCFFSFLNWWHSDAQPVKTIIIQNHQLVLANTQNVKMYGVVSCFRHIWSQTGIFFNSLGHITLRFPLGTTPYNSHTFWNGKLEYLKDNLHLKTRTAHNRKSRNRWRGFFLLELVSS